MSDNHDKILNGELSSGEAAKLFKELESELMEEARLNGMGAERELRLMAEVEALKKELDELAVKYERLVPERDTAEAESFCLRRDVAALTEKVERMEKVVAAAKELDFAWGCFCSHFSPSDRGTTKHTDQCNVLSAALSRLDDAPAKEDKGG